MSASHWAQFSVYLSLAVVATVWLMRRVVIRRRAAETVEFYEDLRNVNAPGVRNSREYP